MLRHLLFALLSLTAALVQAQAPPIVWSETFGGSLNETPYTMINASNGGYLFVGDSWSNNGQVGINRGFSDVWVVKLDLAGNLGWQRSFGGSGFDVACSVVPTQDGGYLIAGSTNSTDGDVAEMQGQGDFWALKLTAAGELEWERTYGGSGLDGAWGVVALPDGGFVLAGESMSLDGQVTAPRGSNDFWLVRINAVGDLLWDGSYGGSSWDNCFGLCVATDGGFVLVGNVGSDDGDVSNMPYDVEQIWVVKVSPTGALEWEKTLGGSSYNLGTSVAAAQDGGFVVGASTASTNGDVVGNHGLTDGWVVKLSAQGDLEWQRCLGGSGDDGLRGITATANGDYVVSGFTNSTDGDVGAPLGGGDGWLIRLNGDGELLWEQCVGGTGGESLRTIVNTTDGGYAALGSSAAASGDVPFNWGAFDCWVVKFGTDFTSVTEQAPALGLTLFPNPAHDVVRLRRSETSLVATLVVYSSAGALMHRSGLPWLGGEYIIPVNTWPSGAYSIQVEMDGKETVLGFVKE